jgi:hypothetical protein
MTKDGRTSVWLCSRCAGCRERNECWSFAIACQFRRAVRRNLMRMNEQNIVIQAGHSAVERGPSGESSTGLGSMPLSIRRPDSVASHHRVIRSESSVRQNSTERPLSDRRFADIAEETDCVQAMTPPQRHEFRQKLRILRRIPREALECEQMICEIRAIETWRAGKTLST